jgi:hypothetical protein
MPERRRVVSSGNTPAVNEGHIFAPELCTKNALQCQWPNFSTKIKDTVEKLEKCLAPQRLQVWSRLGTVVIEAP